MKKRIVLTIAALVFATLAYAQEYIVIENVKGQTKQHDIDIIKLARSLSMFMNQECSLVVKDIIGSEFR